MVSRGFRNNNPGNLRPGKSPWLGQTSVDDGGYCVFDTPEHGLRALAMQLVIYQDKHNCQSVSDIITRWAPSNENDTAAYVKAVAEWLDVSAYAPINLHEQLRLATLIQAIVFHENGHDPYTLQQVDGAADAALA